MRSPKPLLACHAAALAAALLLPPASALAADAANGKTIAVRWCAECHVVSPAQKQAKVDAPTFADIARRKTPPQGNDLQKFLMDPHPKMPDMQISRREADDLVAYMSTLR
jgi:mono/diheme cytochrome c family protein